MPKFRINLLFVLCIVFVPSIYAQSDRDETAILSTIDAFFAALANRDRESLEALTVPGSLNISTSVEADGTSRFSSRNYDELIAVLSRDTGMRRCWFEETSRCFGHPTIFMSAANFHIAASIRFS